MQLVDLGEKTTQTIVLCLVFTLTSLTSQLDEQSEKDKNKDRVSARTSGTHDYKLSFTETLPTSNLIAVRDFLDTLTLFGVTDTQDSVKMKKKSGQNYLNKWYNLPLNCSVKIKHYP